MFEPGRHWLTIYMISIQLTQTVMLARVLQMNSLQMTNSTDMATGGIDMIRTIYSSLCGTLILLAALTPVVIMLLDYTVTI